MKCLELNDDTLRKGWGGVDQYWFSLSDYKIKDITELANLDRPEQMSQTEYYVSIGCIPYFVLTNEEVMRAYVDTLDNAKLKAVLQKIDDDNYVESFWKYFNVYPQMEEHWEQFENEYLLNKAVDWCKRNGINYSIPTV